MGVNNLVKGYFKNSVGILTGAKWHSLGIIKTKPDPTNPRTREQMGVRNMFGALNTFLSRFAPALKAQNSLLFKDMSIRNYLVRLNKDLIDYSRTNGFQNTCANAKNYNVRISKGDISAPFISGGDGSLTMSTFLQVAKGSGDNAIVFSSDASKGVLTYIPSSMIDGDLYAIFLPFTYNSTAGDNGFTSIVTANVLNVHAVPYTFDATNNKYTLNVVNFTEYVAPTAYDDTSKIGIGVYMYTFVKGTVSKHSSVTGIFSKSGLTIDSTAVALPYNEYKSIK